MKLLPLLPLIALMIPAAFAQEAQVEETDTVPTSGSGWSFGGAVMAREGLYAGEDAQIIPLPYFSYDGEHFFFRGLSAGYHIMQNETFSIDATISGNPGLERKDLGIAELAANGVNRDHLEDREWGVDAGISATWRGPFGEVKVEAKTDIMDTSGGQEFSIAYEYPLFLGQTMLIPSIGAKYLSEDLANYQYGTLDSEVARGAPNYKPGAVTIPYVGIGVMHNLDRDWTLFGMADYSILPDEIKDSPLVARDKEGSASIVFGITRAF